MPGTNTSPVEILNLTRHGFLLVLDGETLQMSFADFPWFDGLPLQQLCEVQRPSVDHLYWPSLDVDLSLASIRDPAAFPLVAVR
jgi:hypothetical protein